MEIRVYTPELNLLGIVENFSSLLWDRKYSEAGRFELHVPVMADTVNYLKRGNIIAYEGAVEAGVIESIVAEQGKNNQLTISGRFLESYLDRRLIYINGSTLNGVSHTFNFSGRVEVGMRTLISNAVAIPLLQLGTLHGFTEEITFQATFQNLLRYESQLANSAGFGFRCIPDFVNKTITFDVYKGLDHSENQSNRVRVIFSDDYRNLANTTYTENDQLLKNVCYVGGQGEGEDRVWVLVGDDTLTGLARREVKLDATDIQPDDLTTEQYKAKLTQRGEDLLNNEDILIKSFECDTMPTGNFIYKEHYDLGDIVTVKKEQWGVSLDLRITEITEVYEHGKAVISPIFGNPLPDTVSWEDK